MNSIWKPLKIIIAITVLPIGGLKAKEFYSQYTQYPPSVRGHLRNALRANLKGNLKESELFLYSAINEAKEFFNEDSIELNGLYWRLSHNLESQGKLKESSYLLVDQWIKGLCRIERLPKEILDLLHFGETKIKNKSPTNKSNEKTVITKSEKKKFESLFHEITAARLLKSSNVALSHKLAHIFIDLKEYKNAILFAEYTYKKSTLIENTVDTLKIIDGLDTKVSPDDISVPKSYSSLLSDESRSILSNMKITKPGEATTLILPPLERMAVHHTFSILHHLNGDSVGALKSYQHFLNLVEVHKSSFWRPLKSKPDTNFTNDLPAALSTSTFGPANKFPVQLKALFCSQAEVLSNISSDFLTLGSGSLALQFALKSNEIAMEVDPECKCRVVSEHNVGAIYEAMGDIEPSLKHYRKSWEIANENNDYKAIKLSKTAIQRVNKKREQ